MDKKNLIFIHYKGNLKEIVYKIRDCVNKDILLKLLLENVNNPIYEIYIRNADWRNICLNLKPLTDELDEKIQNRFLVVLIHLSKYKINNLNELEIFYKGLNRGKKIGYKTGYKDKSNNIPNKYIKNVIKPISPKESINNKRIQDWILGNYKSIEEAQNDCNYTSQTEAYLNLLSGRNVFLTGPAGSGKSFVVQQYTNILTAVNPKIKIIKTSTTGISATNIDGITIHSFMSIPFEEFNKDYYEVKERYQKDTKLKRVWTRSNKKFQEADLIIIDEISMMSESFFDFFFEKYRESKTKAQIIVSGDFSQLPPVADKEKIAEFGDKVKNFCFYSKGWKELDFSVCYLDKLYRAKDKKLSRILDLISLGQGNTQEVINSINNLPQTKNKFVKGSALILSTNADVDKINKEEQEKNTSKPVMYDIIYMPELVNDSSFATDEEKLKSCKDFANKSNTLLSKTFKDGDTIMVTSNLYNDDFPFISYEGYDKKLILANGTIGIYRYKEDEDYPYIEVKGKLILLPEKISKKTRYEQDPKNQKENIEIVEAAYKEFPIKLAYAITIHKSQGQTFSNITCDLTKTFMPGLGYVALSRATSYEGITLLNEKGKIHPFNHLSLEIGEQSLEVKKETQRLALVNRNKSDILLKTVLDNPISYIKNNFKRAFRKKK